MSRRRKTGESAVSFREKTLKSSQIYGSPSDLQKGSSHVANHVMQKAVPFDGQEQAAALFLQLATKNAPDGGGSGGAGFRKTGEIMFSDEQTRSPRHFLKIDRERVMEIFPHQMWRKDSS